MGSVLFLLGCNNSRSNNTTTGGDSIKTYQDTVSTNTFHGIPSLKPDSTKPAWAPGMDDNMQVIIEQLASYGEKPVSSLTAVEARRQHSPADAVSEVIKKYHVAIPQSMVDTSGIEIPVDNGSLHARIYRPKKSDGPLPVIVYYHGGGWVIAGINTYDASAKGLAEQTGAIVVSVHYRQGPEYKFPIAHNDAFAAYKWILQNAASIHADPKIVAVVG